MATVHQTYNDPEAFLSGLIDAGQFSAGVDHILAAADDAKTWAFFLHKVEGKTFQEFKNGVTRTPAGAIPKMTPQRMDETIKSSQNVLNLFT